ncbi:uncharacterized protein B0H18DRAFT_965737 [Fomitopsis serialis]|uniref:uncharacterized protein n=1 Tax=Fomitopsis serialis TaxID=139415 RepID=UPI0020077D19|nr:uncharacterized protein B0H18DRAFT_965737 [Neoantrodia serialis]KAH9938131.1 hypothetical protein B0H18DRAFT_965737 [Neoantrodia serialis]
MSIATTRMHGNCGRTRLFELRRRRKRLEAAGTDRAQPSPLADAIQRILSHLSRERTPSPRLLAVRHSARAAYKTSSLHHLNPHHESSAYTHSHHRSNINAVSFATMTRTERAVHAAALVKDRSVSKNGMDTRLPKGGAGGHNWGNLSREQYLEEAASYDEAADFAEEGREALVEAPPRPTTGRRTSQLTEEELQQAIKLRKKAAHSNDVDLGSIARSSAAVSHSPPNKDVLIVNGVNTTAVTA